MSRLFYGYKIIVKLSESIETVVNPVYFRCVMCILCCYWLCSEERSIGMFWHNAAETWIDVDHRESSRHVSLLFALFCVVF